jgi:hypothetical protein
MDKRYTQNHEGIIFLVIPDEAVAWQQDFADKLFREKQDRMTLPQRVERQRMERALDQMYTGGKQ